MLSIFACLQVYVGWHLELFLSEWLGLEGSAFVAVFWPVYAIVAFSYLLSRIFGRRLPAPVALGLRWTGSYWIGLFEYAALLPFADLAAWLLRALDVSNADAIMSVGSAVILILLAIMLRGSWNAWSRSSANTKSRSRSTRENLKELHIAVASDLHLGATVGGRHLDRLVRRANALRPDLMLLPGDVLDDDVQPFISRRFGEQLARIQAKFGTYAVLGNHEYYGGGIETFVPAMQALGMPVLRDDVLTIGGSFYLVGRKDKTDRPAPPWPN